jgi:sirohydrochlorin cobaltochelatase
MGKQVILLAMHGAPPSDFPASELAELFCMRARIELSNGPERALYEGRFHELEAKIRAWPRTASNDPSHAGSLELASHLSQAIGYEVVLGFIEFSNPSLDEAFGQAVQQGTERITVVTPMMTPGGEHSEKDIPQAIQRARQRFPEIEVQYAWPFSIPHVAIFLATQIAEVAEKKVIYGT